jgi:hypothetical protein
MKGYVCLFVIVTATALVAQSNPSPDESAVLSLQRQWLEASQKGNGEVLRGIIDNNFVGSTPDNHIINKESLFPPSGSVPMFAKTHFAGLDAKVIGNTAVVFGEMITASEPTALRCAMVYRKQAGRWKMIAAQLVPVSETKGTEAQ